ncbi:MAG: hypothetical protein CL928_00295 [Deltaproteobacteria bacterium]|nr:hypothetical protein [Deltaproteobacteria bacterium]
MNDNGLSWSQRSSGLVPALSGSALQLLSAVPSGMRQRAVGWSLSAAPLARSIESELVNEVSRCWADIPLPRSLPEIIDDARRLQLTLLLEQPSALADGPETTGLHLEVQSLQPLERMLEGGRSALVVTPTFGAWQVIAPGLARRGYAVAFLDLRPPAARPSRPQPPGPGLDLLTLPSRGLARSLVQCAKGAPRVIVMQGDEGCGSRWANGTLLGRSASVGSTPFELARRYDLGLLPVFAVRQNGLNRLRVEAPLKISDTGRGDGDLDTTAGRWLKLVDRYARRHPEQYLPFLLDRRLRRMDDPLPLFADALDPGPQAAER